MMNLILKSKRQSQKRRYLQFTPDYFGRYFPTLILPPEFNNRPRRYRNKNFNDSDVAIYAAASEKLFDYRKYPEMMEGSEKLYKSLSFISDQKTRRKGNSKPSDKQNGGCVLELDERKLLLDLNRETPRRYFDVIHENRLSGRLDFLEPLPVKIKTHKKRRKFKDDFSVSDPDSASEDENVNDFLALLEGPSVYDPVTPELITEVLHSPMSYRFGATVNAIARKLRGHKSKEFNPSMKRFKEEIRGKLICAEKLGMVLQQDGCYWISNDIKTGKLSKSQVENFWNCYCDKVIAKTYSKLRRRSEYFY